MIKLTKIVLINWMYFQKVTLPLEGNAAIVGDNGAGKSTIMDAIQLLLLGQKSAKFNANANAEKRTLESYVRGAVTVENKPYLREGDVVTYLALEMLENGTKHVLGINVEYKSLLNKLDGPKYFYVKNMDLSDDIFVKDNYPKTYDVLSREFKHGFEYISFPTLHSYQIKLKDILGLKDETTYFKTLSRAVGIKNITDCNTFMNEFVLDENNIDVSSIKNNIQEIEKVSKTIENEKIKLNKLNELVEVGENIEANNTNLSNEKIKNSLLNVNFYKRKIDSFKSENLNQSSIINDYENQKKSFKQVYNDLLSTHFNLNKSLEQIFPELPYMNAELKRLEDEYETVHVTLNTFKSLCQNELANISVLTKYKNSAFDSFYCFLKKEDYTTEIARKEFVNFRDEAVEFVKIYREKFATLKNDRHEIKKQLTELEEIIRKLKNNQLEYKKELRDFIDYIRHGLKEKYNKDIEVKFLCEYLDITDDEWRNAIEGYLGNKRFFIVVPNEYYIDALKLYDAKKDFYHTQIINGTKIPEYDFEKNVLGEFVVSSNVTALNYARFILNRVHCAKNIYELDSFDIAITKECMVYQGYSSGRINPRYYKEQYIGQTGIKNQLIMRLEQEKELKEIANDLNVRCNTLFEMINTIDKESTFASNIIEDNKYFNSIDRDSILFDSIGRIKAEIKFYESKPQYFEINNKITEIENEIEKCKNTIANYEGKIIECKTIINTNNKHIEEQEDNLKIYDAKLCGVSTDKLDQINSVLDSLEITESIIRKSDNEIKRLDESIFKAKYELEGLMKSVRDLFSINIEPKFEFLNEYKNEKNKINTEIFQHETKFVDLKKKYINLFFSQFLTKLYNLIENARKTIDNLNYSLGVFPFGNDYYKIKMSITSDKELELIYNYAKEYNSDDSERGIFMDREAESRARTKIMDILNTYMFSDDFKIRERIVDYRKYLYFDVEAHTPNGIKKLNQVMKTQSGGEVQVPFYILSGVAFQQTLDFKRRKNDCLGIVLYDEAFDKMDSQRIQSMLQFYRDKLKLQLILATPGKIDSLVDNMETILVIVRDGENAIVSDYNHEVR